MTQEQDPPTGEPADETERLPSQRLTAEDKYYLEQAYKDPVESAARLEETAKFLIGATAMTSGLFAAAYKLALGKATATGITWFLPFLFWAASILMLTLVLLPNRYEVVRHSPADYRTAMLRARDRKWLRLAFGAGLFAVGLLFAVLPFQSS